MVTLSTTGKDGGTLTHDLNTLSVMVGGHPVLAHTLHREELYKVLHAIGVPGITAAMHQQELLLKYSLYLQAPQPAVEEPPPSKPVSLEQQTLRQACISTAAKQQERKLVAQRSHKKRK